MRARGDASGSVFTADTIADKYGVVQGSYNSIALPATETYQVGTQLHCKMQFEIWFVLLQCRNACRQLP